MKKLILTIVGCIFMGLACIFMSVNAYSSEIKADKILILKSERKIYLMKKDETLKEYDISLGFAPIGHKEKQGDGKTPEGIYKISGRNPQSSYHYSLRVSYPNSKDIAVAKKKGVNPGGDIMIHGLPNSMPFVGKAHLLSDWTLGCIAVTNEEIEEIARLTPNGAIVEIRP